VNLREYNPLDLVLVDGAYWLISASQPTAYANAAAFKSSPTTSRLVPETTETSPGGGGGTVTISPAADNQLTDDGQGLYVPPPQLSTAQW
jgi:hypothetical protein